MNRRSTCAGGVPRRTGVPGRRARSASFYRLIVNDVARPGGKLLGLPARSCTASGGAGYSHRQTWDWYRESGRLRSDPDMCGGNFVRRGQNQRQCSTLVLRSMLDVRGCRLRVTGVPCTACPRRYTHRCRTTLPSICRPIPHISSDNRPNCRGRGRSPPTRASVA
jgi:hypothetical protein